jgi:hypothetical protein
MDFELLSCWADGHTFTYIRKARKKRETETDRQTDRERERDTERKDREKDRERKTERERQRERLQLQTGELAVVLLQAKCRAFQAIIVRWSRKVVS